MTLSPRQAHLIECAMEPGMQRTITAVCEAAGVTRVTFYRWVREDSDFREAWEDAWRGSIRRQLPGVAAAMIHQALAGDVRAARLVVDMAGVVTREHKLTLPTLREEAERLARATGLNVDEIMAEAEAILKALE